VGDGFQSIAHKWAPTGEALSPAPLHAGREPMGYFLPCLALRRIDSIAPWVIGW